MYIGLLKLSLPTCGRTTRFGVKKRDAHVNELKESIAEYKENKKQQTRSLCNTTHLVFYTTHQRKAFGELIQRWKEDIKEIAALKRDLFGDHLITMIDYAHNGIVEYLEDWVKQIHQRYKKSVSRGKMRDPVQCANYQCRQDKIYHNDSVKKIQVHVKQVRSQKCFNRDHRNALAADKRSEARQARCLVAVADATGLFEAHPIMKSALGI